VDVIMIKKSDFQRYIRESKSARDNLKFRWKARLVADAKSMIRLQNDLRERLFRKGDLVYREGDMGESMYFVDEKNGGKFIFVKRTKDGGTFMVL
jgi:CRP-like cAMP-binding protein